MSAGLAAGSWEAERRALAAWTRERSDLAPCTRRDSASSRLMLAC